MNEKFFIYMKNGIHDNGCLMGRLNINKGKWKQFITTFIDQKDLYIDYSNTDMFDGYQLEPHVTIAYGFDKNKNQYTSLYRMMIKNRSLIEKINPGITAINIFEAQDYDVVKFELVCPHLVKLSNMVYKQFGLVNSYGEYKPHVTIAYVKKGTGKKYIKNVNLPDVFKINELVYQD